MIIEKTINAQRIVPNADLILQPEHSSEAHSPVLPNPIGSELTAADYSALDARWIDRSLADRAHLRRVNSMTGCEIVGRRGGNYAGIVIPYFLPGSDQVREYRLRRDQPDLEYDSAGNVRAATKVPQSPRPVQHALSGARSRSIAAERPRAANRRHRGRIQDAGPLATGQSCVARVDRGFFPWGFPASTTGAARSEKRSVRTAAAWM